MYCYFFDYLCKSQIPINPKATHSTLKTNPIELTIINFNNPINYV